MKSSTVKINPLGELLQKKLFGLPSGVPEKEPQKMINRAIVAAISYDQEQRKRIDKLSGWIDNCRDYLMQVNSSELTVEDCLEALGFNRNGFDE